MKVRGEVKDRIRVYGSDDDSLGVTQLPKFNESIAKRIENPSLVVGIMYHNNTASYPSKAVMGAYVIVEAGDERFVSIEDPVYEGPDAESGKYQAGYRALEMAFGIADMLGEDIDNLNALKKQLYNNKLLSNQSQS
jgi:hypothetical protein